MNVQMRLITADNIEQLTKEGNRRINERSIMANSKSNSPEDIFEPTVSKDEEIQPDLFSREEKIKIIELSDNKIQEFIDSHDFYSLTPLQKKNFFNIVGNSAYYMRLQGETGDNELYKLVLKEEIDKLREPTNSNIAQLEELYGKSGALQNQPNAPNAINQASRQSFARSNRSEPQPEPQFEDSPDFKVTKEGSNESQDENSSGSESANDNANESVHESVNESANDNAKNTKVVRI
jgi:hypothetical protein